MVRKNTSPPQMQRAGQRGSCSQSERFEGSQDVYFVWIVFILQTNYGYQQKRFCGVLLNDKDIIAVYRILDANCNRLREALRVAEEHYRFVLGDSAASVKAKELRHLVPVIEKELGSGNLLGARDTGEDLFAREVRPEERTRGRTASVCAANLKRGQEAARVIEEYAKMTGSTVAVDQAKAIRFSLYDLEKQFPGLEGNG